jgi:predicted metalloenzyme YecM
MLGRAKSVRMSLLTFGRRESPSVFEAVLNGRQCICLLYQHLQTNVSLKLAHDIVGIMNLQYPAEQFLQTWDRLSDHMKNLSDKQLEGMFLAKIEGKSPDLVARYGRVLDSHHKKSFFLA